MLGFRTETALGGFWLLARVMPYSGLSRAGKTFGQKRSFTTLAVRGSGNAAVLNCSGVNYFRPFYLSLCMRGMKSCAQQNMPSLFFLSKLWNIKHNPSSWCLKHRIALKWNRESAVLLLLTHLVWDKERRFTGKHT